MTTYASPKKGILIIEPDQAKWDPIRRLLERRFPLHAIKFLFGMWAINMHTPDLDMAVVVFRPTPEVTDRLLPIAMNDLRQAYPETKLLLISESPAAVGLAGLMHRQETTVESLIEDIASLMM